MVFISHGLGDHVIYIDFHGSSNVVAKDFVHQSLVGGSSVLQSKGYDLIITIYLFFVIQAIFSLSRGCILI